MFIYSDHSKPFTGSVDFTKMNASKKYLTHYDNLLTLEFILANSKDRNERCQVEKEMAIARRKMKFWERMPNYSQVDVPRGCAELKKKWSK